jgi:hypothetical protein
MDEILKSVVKLTKLCNELPVNQELSSQKNILKVDLIEDKSQEKELKKACKNTSKKILDQTVEIHKYVNPVNSKVLDQMKK